MNNFEMWEFEKSSTALRHGIDNSIPANLQENVRLLVEKVLDPAREHFDTTISVNSGYRCPKLNSIVGGSKNSQHMTALAADVELGDKTTEENKLLFEWIKNNCEFDQLIWECGGAWVHVSYKKEGNRNQILSL